MVLINHERNEVSQTFPCKIAQKERGCKADCCGCVPINKTVFEANKDKFQRKIINLYEFGEDVLPITLDGSCVFVDENFDCLIYLQRPDVCRKYGWISSLFCPYISSEGILRSKKNSKEVHELIDYMVKNTLENINKKRGE